MCSLNLPVGRERKIAMINNNNVFDSIVISFVIISLFINKEASSSLRDRPSIQEPLVMNIKQINKLARLINQTHFEATLKQIAIPRVVGTPNIIKVKQFITSSMKELGWNVEIDTFKETVPILRELTFNNIIARLNPAAERYLVIACHYDSKYFPSGTFVGATDSAVPCAMMINLARTMKRLLNGIKNESSLSLMFIFFDGEEAFQSWTNTDSIYGARHLASKWANNTIKEGNYLQRLDVIVLLDLLGVLNPNFVSYYLNTLKLYQVLIDAETTLASLKLLSNYTQKYFLISQKTSTVEDDHKPFLERGVPILHIIATPFPAVWHRETDNLKYIDLPTCENLNMILRIFTARYLHLNI